MQPSWKKNACIHPYEPVRELFCPLAAFAQQVLPALVPCPLSFSWEEVQEIEWEPTKVCLKKAFLLLLVITYMVLSADGDQSS